MDFGTEEETNNWYGRDRKTGYKEGQLKVLNDLENFLATTKGYPKSDILSAVTAWIMTYQIEVRKQLK